MLRNRSTIIFNFLYNIAFFNQIWLVKTLLFEKQGEKIIFTPIKLGGATPYHLVFGHIKTVSKYSSFHKK